MKQKLLTFSIFLFFVSFLSAQIPSGYYDDAQDLSGYALKSTLSTIITDGHNPQTYGDLWDAYYTSDVDIYYENDDTVLDVYSENPDGADSYEYTFGSDQCGSSGYQNEGDCYNREHLFPKSWFDGASPMVTDIQHIYPTDGEVNSQRGNFPFGEVGTATFTSDNGSKKGNNVYDFPGAYDGTVFEPIDEFKGDIARVYLYMATRYENQIAGWEQNSAQTEHALNGTSSQVFDTWFLDMLLTWHAEDPVSQKEIDRNNVAYTFQGNRNPYIDHPEYVAMIWSLEEDNEAPTAPTNLSASGVTGNSVDLTWTAATDNVGVLAYDLEQDGSIITSTEDTNYTVEGLSGSTTYSYVVYARDAYANVSEGSNTETVTTQEGPTYLVTENFDVCPPENFEIVSELSEVDWQCTDQFGEDNSPAVQMNSYFEGSQVPSIDWLITTNPISFDDYTDEKVSFFTAATFGNTELQFLYSTDYDGNGSPSNFTWEPVPNVEIPLHPDGGSAVVENTFDNIDISSIEGDTYLAFKYDTSNGEQATRWNVDSFVVTGTEVLGTQNFKEQSFRLYPNPVSNGVVNFDFSTSETYSYYIYDIQGRILKRGKVSEKHQEVTINQLPSGLYLVHINSTSGSFNQKLIVN